MDMNIQTAAESKRLDKDPESKFLFGPRQDLQNNYCCLCRSPNKNYGTEKSIRLKKDER